MLFILKTKCEENPKKCLRSCKLEADAWTAIRNSIDICGKRECVKALCSAKQSERKKIQASNKNKYEGKTWSRKETKLRAVIIIRNVETVQIKVYLREEIKDELKHVHKAIT